MKEVYDFLKKCKVYYLATVDGDKPRVRPFGTVNIFENKLYIQTGKKKDVSKQIHLNPNVEICAFDGEDWIRLTGVLMEDTRVEAKRDLLKHYPSLAPLYDEYDENTEVFYFKEGHAVVYSFKEAPKEYNF